MKKNTILKKLETHEEKLVSVIDGIKDFLDSIEDEEISIMAEDFSDLMLDIIHENDTCSLNDIREFIENVYDHE